jgi:hypothetical protein
MPDALGEITIKEPGGMTLETWVQRSSAFQTSNQVRMCFSSLIAGQTAAFVFTSGFWGNTGLRSTP